MRYVFASDGFVNLGPEYSVDNQGTLTLLYVPFAGNYRSAINDATVARKLQPTYMKAILRGE